MGRVRGCSLHKLLPRPGPEEDVGGWAGGGIHIQDKVKLIKLERRKLLGNTVEESEFLLVLKGRVRKIFL